MLRIIPAVAVLYRRRSYGIESCARAFTLGRRFAWMVFGYGDMVVFGQDGRAGDGRARVGRNWSSRASLGMDYSRQGVDAQALIVSRAAGGLVCGVLEQLEWRGTSRGGRKPRDPVRTSPSWDCRMIQVRCMGFVKCRMMYKEPSRPSVLLTRFPG